MDNVPYDEGAALRLLDAWTCFGSEPMRLTDVINTANSRDGRTNEYLAPKLRRAILGVLKNNVRVAGNAHTLSLFLRSIKNKPIGGYMIVTVGKPKRLRWKLLQVNGKLMDSNVLVNWEGDIPP